MLKLTIRRFAVAALAAAFGISGAAATAQLTQTPAPPRSDTTRSNTAQPEADSRAGGSLSPDAEPAEGAEVIDSADIRAADADVDVDVPAADADVDADPDLDTAAGAVFAGMVTGVADGRISVQMTPPRVSKAQEQVFKVSTETAIINNSQRTKLGSIRKGQFVRITTLPGDSEIAAKIVVATPPSQRATPTNALRRPPRSEPAVAVDAEPLDEDQNPNFDVFPDRDSAPTPPRDNDEFARGGNRALEQRWSGGEEAVLPLGIEVFGPGEGALVTEMLANGPAASAGVLIGDLITAVNGRPVGDPELIENLMSANDATGATELTILRDGQVMQITVQPAAVVQGGLTTFAAVQGALQGHGLVGAGAVGTGVALPLGATGFTDFADGGVTIAGEPGRLVRGLSPNDVIVGFNGQPITTRAQLLDALNSLPADADGLNLSVLRNGERVDVNIPRAALNTNAGSAAGRNNVRARGNLGTGNVQQGATGTRTGTNIQQGTGNRQQGIPRAGTQRGLQQQQGTQQQGAQQPRQGAQQQQQQGTGQQGAGAGGTGSATQGTGTGVNAGAGAQTGAGAAGTGAGATGGTGTPQ